MGNGVASLDAGWHLEIIVRLAVVVPGVAILHQDSASLLLAIVLEHLVLVASLGFELNHQLSTVLRSLSLGHEVVVATRAVLVSLLELFDLLAEHLFALLAGENHLGSLLQLVVLFLLMALGTVEPLAAAGSANRDLGVQNVFAHY